MNFYKELNLVNFYFFCRRGIDFAVLRQASLANHGLAVLVKLRLGVAGRGHHARHAWHSHVGRVALRHSMHLGWLALAV